MKKTAFITVIFILILSLRAFADFQNETDTLLNQTGELKEYAIESANGNPDFSEIFGYIKDLFFKEFKNIGKNFPVLFTLAILFSLKNCVNLDKEIGRVVDFAFTGSVILLTTNILQDIFNMAKSLCEALGSFVMVAIPCLCGVMASSGYPVSATKGAFIILGASNILSFLINSVFFPVLYITYIFSVASFLVDNDIFEAVKKATLSVVKVSLPFIVGIFTTILAIFMKSSSKIDDFVLKSAKLTIGNIVPFLGNILSDSAYVVVSSVGHIKSQLGIIGIFGILSILIFPIIKMICTLITFKVLSVVCCFTQDKKSQKHYSELSEIVSVTAGMTGTMAVMVLIGILILMG